MSMRIRNGQIIEAKPLWSAAAIAAALPWRDGQLVYLNESGKKAKAKQSSLSLHGGYSTTASDGKSGSYRSRTP